MTTQRRRARGTRQRGRREERTKEFFIPELSTDVRRVWSLLSPGALTPRGTAAPQRVFSCRPRHQRGSSDQCQRTYTRHASFPPHIAMPTRCRSDLCTRCAQPVSTRSSSTTRVGVLLYEQNRAAQHAGHLRCPWRRSIRRCRRAAGAGLIRACSVRRIKWCFQTEGTQISGVRHAFAVGQRR